MPTKKIPIALIAAFLVASGGTLFAAKTVVGGFFRERAIYSSLRAQINDIQYKRDQLVLAQASAQGANSDVARVERAFVDQAGILNVLVPLEREEELKGISDYKVTIAQDISFSGLLNEQTNTDKSSSSTLQGTTLRIEGSGTLENLFEFIRTLQGLPYFLRIESLQLQQAGQASAQTGAISSGATPLHAMIIVKFYHLP